MNLFGIYPLCTEFKQLLNFVSKSVVNNKFQNIYIVKCTADMLGYISSGSSGRVRGGRGPRNMKLCGRLWQPSFLWLIFTWPGPPPGPVKISHKKVMVPLPLPGSATVHSHRAKIQAKAKIFFDVRLFPLNLFCFRSVWIDPYSAIHKATGLTVPGRSMIWLVLFHRSNREAVNGGMTSGGRSSWWFFGNGR